MAYSSLHWIPRSTPNRGARVCVGNRSKNGTRSTLGRPRGAYFPFAPEWKVVAAESASIENEVEGYVFVHRVDGRETKQHPAETYFLKLLEYEREQAAAEEKGRDEEKTDDVVQRAWMDFPQIGDAGNHYYYNFCTRKSTTKKPPCIITAPIHALGGQETMVLKLMRDVDDGANYDREEKKSPSTKSVLGK